MEGEVEDEQVAPVVRGESSRVGGRLTFDYSVGFYSNIERDY